MTRRKLRTALQGAVLVLFLFAGYLTFTLPGIFPEESDLSPRGASFERSELPIHSASETAVSAPASPLDLAPAEIAFQSDETPLMSPRPLLIPVAGVGPFELEDTYSHARSEGRRHDAIDIVAPHGTPVLAAADGTVLKLFVSEQGGITLYQLDPDQRTIYYYAHLDRYASNIVEGMRLRQGDTIGYVGNTGNSGPGNYHLHFEISTTPNPEQYWGGAPSNPYPLLRGTTAPRQ